MQTRLLSAMVLIPLVLAVLFYIPVQYLSYIFIPCFALVLFEWLKLITTCKFLRSIGFIISIALSALVLLPQFMDSIVLAATLCWYLPVVFVLFYPFATKLYFNNKLFAVLFASILLSLSWVCFYYLSVIASKVWILLLLVIVWGADSGAYFAGKLLGRHHLAPSLSPNKTWEGFLGGLITSFIFVGVFLFYLKDLYFTDFEIFALSNELSFALLVVFLSASTFIMAVVGDLYQSGYKRLANVKDSGAIIPGHGGMYDRLDSFIAVIPVYTLFIASMVQ